MATNYDPSGSELSQDSSSDESSSSGSRDIIDLSHQGMTEIELEFSMEAYVADADRRSRIRKIFLHNNRLENVPPVLGRLSLLTTLDLSSNLLSSVPEFLCSLTGLTKLHLRNNFFGDDDLPKHMGNLPTTLKDLNLSGNRFTTIPSSVLSLKELRNLYVGANHLTHVPAEIGSLTKLRVLYLGGNQLRDLPEEICRLSSLKALILSGNKLQSLPDSICHLRRLSCLQLHQNDLTTLPHALIFLKGLKELSLRDNPLVMRFVREMNFLPSTLREIAAQTVKVHNISFRPGDIPQALIDYMTQAHSCVNSKCKGVYFDSRVEHVKFVDFCGKYRVPLMQYLCSSRCNENQPAYQNIQDEDEPVKMRRILLG